MSFQPEVKATLIPGKKGVLLRRQAGVRHRRRHGNERARAMSTRFKGKVSLFQDEIELHAGELLFESRDNRISCRGNADLKFLDDGEPGDPARENDRLRSRRRPRSSSRARPGCSRGRTPWPPAGSNWLFGRDDKLENIDAADQVTFSKGRSVRQGAAPALAVRPQDRPVPQCRRDHPQGRRDDPRAGIALRSRQQRDHAFPAPATAPRRPSASERP